MELSGHSWELKEMNVDGYYTIRNRLTKKSLDNNVDVAQCLQATINGVILAECCEQGMPTQIFQLQINRIIRKNVVVNEDLLKFLLAHFKKTKVIK